MSKVLSASLLVLLLAGSNAFALRILGPVESSYELSLGDVILPRSTAGTVIFKPCDTCDTTSLTVNASTQYFIDDVEYAFADFSRLAQNIKNSNGGNSQTAVYIHYSVKNPHVTRLRLARL